MCAESFRIQALDCDSRIFAATEQTTIIRPVLRVHTAKCLGIYGIEIQIPSTISSKKTSWVVICRGQNRYVEESHHLEPGPIPPVRHYCERERGLKPVRHTVNYLFFHVLRPRRCEGLSNSTANDVGITIATAEL